MVSFLQYPKRKLRKMVQRGEYAEALEFGKSIEPEYREDHDFLFIMGSIHYILDDPSNAISYFDVAISLQHGDVEALMLKTNAHLSLNQPQDAAACCMHILKINPDHTEARSLLKDLQG